MTESSHEPTKRIDRRHALAAIGTGLTSIFAGCSARGSGRSGTPSYQSGNTSGDELSENTSPNATQATAAATRAETKPADYAINLGVLELRNHYIGVKDSYKGVVIQGTVEHTGNQRLELAEVRSRIYNTDGTYLGFYLDSINALDPGTKWNFDIIVLEKPSNIGSYGIATVGSVG